MVFEVGGISQALDRQQIKHCVGIGRLETVLAPSA